MCKITKAPREYSITMKSGNTYSGQIYEPEVLESIAHDTHAGWVWFNDVDSTVYVRAENVEGIVIWHENE